MRREGQFDPDPRGARRPGSGQKGVVHLSLRGGESPAAWATVCADLAGRGVQTPALCIVDGSKGEELLTFCFRKLDGWPDMVTALTTPT